ncbi:MAG: transglycosylase SLT domain-containing protein, partial [Acidobacteriota bacterium]|nr:transglycosylase SLT domain-containing protein [Acidobacteriota bacterium]
VDTENLIDQVARGLRDLTVADSNLIRACREYRDDVRAAIDVSANRPIAWAIRHNSPELLEHLNRFLTSHELEQRDNRLDRADLAGIKERRVLRVLTVNSAATYFLWRGRLMGFEYELMQQFAESEDLQLEMIVPPSQDLLVPWLEEGRGDVISASFYATDNELPDSLVFARPYGRVDQVIVVRSGENAPEVPLDLTGRTIAVHRNSPYWQTLEILQSMGIRFGIRAVPDDMQLEEIIARVAEGEYDLTLASSHIVDIELTWRDDIKKGLAVREEIPLSWVVRADNPQLKTALDRFIKTEYRGLFYNVIHERYFTDRRRIRNRVAVRQNLEGQLSPYDEIVRKYAEEYGFDWRMIVAQMYEESAFDPGALSFAGARGLMQVLPRTARELGFEDLEDPETSIQAGIEYMAWVRDRFEEDLRVRDRMWFTLAAYNAGTGHVRDARRLAGNMNLDRDVWFGNVEEAMLLLSRPQFARSAAHGYCRCHEPVDYVRSIRERYNAYIEIAPTTMVADNRKRFSAH